MSASAAARAAVEVQAGEDSPVLALQLRQLMKKLTPQDQRTIEQVSLFERYQYSLSHRKLTCRAQQSCSISARSNSALS